MIPPALLEAMAAALRIACVSDGLSWMESDHDTKQIWRDYVEDTISAAERAGYYLVHRNMLIDASDNIRSLLQYYNGDTKDDEGLALRLRQAAGGGP